MESAGKVLIIDDDAIVRQSVVAYLEDSGFEVCQAEDGARGMELFRLQQPDLVICDLRMPNVDGMSVLKLVASDPSETPVIVVSGAGVMSDVVDALRLGASDYFIKPVADLGLLDHSIRRSLEQSQLRKENRRYRQQLEKANRDLQANLSMLEQDQQAGRHVQMKMLPETPKKIGTYCLSHHVSPSLYLSGDFVEYVTVGQDHITFFIADVSGHGASSAFVTVLLKNLAARLRSNYMHNGEQTILSPSAILKKANSEMLALELGKHVTMFVAVLHMPSNTLRYSIAGHLPAPIISDGVRAQYLSGKGRPVGLFEDVDYEEYPFKLADSFSLTLFSDGVLEILSQSSLAEKEKFLLSLFQGHTMPLEEVIGVLGLDQVVDAPDDIAVMSVTRSVNDAAR